MSQVSPPDLAQLHAGHQPTIWRHGSDAESVQTIGVGEFARLTASGRGRFEELQEQFSALCAALPAYTSGVRAFVSATFSPVSQATSVLIVPRIQWHIGPAGVRVIDLSDLMAEAPEVPQPPRGASRVVAQHSGELSDEAFLTGVREAVRRIEAGELAKTVLARDEVIELDGHVPIGPLAAALAEAYPTCWTYCVDGLIGASPEMLVRVRNGEVASRALAGSAPVSGDLDADEAAAEDLMTSAKDTSEHAYAARSVIEVLRRIADVQVSDTHVLRLPTIMHLATDVSGYLRGDHSALQVAGQLHPSAAICGTPREAAARVLAELEGFDRGRYSGPVGWVDDSGNGEFVIALRCARIEGRADGQDLRMYAGAGIVVGSDPQRELAETYTKMLPIRRAIARVLP